MGTQFFESTLTSESADRVTRVRPGSAAVLMEAAPIFWVTVALWFKFVYFSIAMRGWWWIEGWMPQAPLGIWLIEHLNLLSATLAVLLLFLAPMLLLPRLLRASAAVILGALGTTVVVANLIHARFYSDVVSIWSLSTLENAVGTLSSVTDLLRPVHALLYLDVLVAAIALPVWYSRIRNRAKPAVKAAHRWAVAMGAGGILLAVPTVFVISRDDTGAFGFATLQRDVCERIGLLPYHVWDASMRILQPRNAITDADRSKVVAFYDQLRQNAPPPGPLYGAARGRNVLLISGESLQSYVLGLKLDGQSVAPRLTELAEESLHFTNVYDQTHLGTTSDGEFLALQSLHPLPVGVVVHLYHQNRFRALPAVLAEQGYATLSAVAEPASFWRMSAMHAKYGFQRSYFEESFRFTERINGWGADHQFFPQVANLLARQKRPFFAYVISSSSHRPWVVPAHERRLRLGRLEGTEIGRYLQSINYFDHAFGEFMDSLRATGLLDSTVVVIYGDHQSFGGEPELLAQLNGISGSDDIRLLDTRKRIPLMIRQPSGEGARLEVPGGQIDIAPTILGLLGIRDASSVMLGRDLTRGERSAVIFRDGSFTDGDYYLINRLGNSICYDISRAQRLDCAPFRAQRLRALQRLEISDLILRGDMIPALTRRNPDGT